MSWNLIYILGAMLAVLPVLKGLALVSSQAARTYLKQGSLVVDVRSVEEFKASHLPSAVNMPLRHLPEEALRCLPNKNQRLLLHCLSGTRSEIAKRMLKQQGYSQVFNLGSYGRARRIVSG
jgi:phage shock protein E